MKKNILPVMIFSALLFSFNAKAQADSTAQKTKPKFKLGVFYNSGLNYYGRTDSLRSSGFFPLAELWFDKHFYINAAPVFVINKVSNFEYAGSVVSAGVRFGKEKKYSSNIYVVKPLYKDNSQLVQSALKAQVAAAYTKLTKVINITAGGDVKFSDKVDYGLTAGIDHIFRKELASGIVLVADPSAYINAGTQQFTSTSYKQSGFLFFPGVQQEITEQVTNFNILSYEFSMPMVLAKGKFLFIVNPAYVIPQNLVVIKDRPDLSERGKEMFYVTAGMKVTF